MPTHLEQTFRERRVTRLQRAVTDVLVRLQRRTLPCMAWALTDAEAEQWRRRGLDFVERQKKT